MKYLLFLLLISSFTLFGQKKAAKEKEAPPKFISVKEFNKIHKDDFFKLVCKKDTFLLGEDYWAYIEIDPTKIKDPSKISLAWASYPFERKKNKFRVSFILFQPGVQRREFIITNNGGPKPVEQKFLIEIYVKNMINSSGSFNEIGYAEPMPKYNSKEYKDFKEYILKNCKTAGITLKGEMELEIVVMSDGTVKFKRLKKSNLDYDEEDKLKVIVEKCKGWSPGIYEGKKRNVTTYANLKF